LHFTLESRRALASSFQKLLRASRGRHSPEYSFVGQSMIFIAVVMHLASNKVRLCATLIATVLILSCGSSGSPKHDTFSEPKGSTLQGDLYDRVCATLLFMDNALEDLPDASIKEFARSSMFNVYKSVFESLGLAGEPKTIMRRDSDGSVSFDSALLGDLVKSERSLVLSFSRGCKDTNPFEIVDCGPARGVVFPPFPHRVEFFRVLGPLQSSQAATS
jgi:hypothetical protein